MSKSGNYRSYRGKVVDLDAIRVQHEKEIAVGNMNVNAKGDKLGPGGEIIETSAKRVRQHYNTTTSTKSSVSIKGDQVDGKIFNDEKKETKTVKKDSKKKLVEEENELGDITMVESNDKD